MRLTVRTRLTLWYTAVLSGVLAAAGWAAYAGYERSRLAQLDGELARVGELAVRSLAADQAEGVALEEAASDALEDLELAGRELGVFDASGRLVAGRAEGLAPGPRAAPGAAAEVTTLAGAGGDRRVRRSWHAYGDSSYRLALTQSLAPLEADLARLRRALVLATLSALALAAAGGLWIARAALRPLARMAAEADRVTGSTPGFRIGVPPARDELRVLGDALNELLGRLDRALAQQRQFMADASHELRTPLSVARTATDVALSASARPEADYRDSLEVVGEQLGRLSRLVDDMFVLARADVSQLALERERLYLDELVAGCVRDARLVAAARPATLDFSGPPDVEAVGDVRRLRQMVANLLDNAIRHTPAGGRVLVELAAGAGFVELAVSDSGPGVPEADRERIFERFVRLDPSRRAADGAGLGLPIARVIAETHGGTLRLDRSDAAGSRFVVRLPAAPREAHNS